MNPDISFIFVNFRSAALIERSLQALRAIADVQVRAEYIIINNDTAEEDSLDELGRRFPDIRIIQVGENQGFGRANNQAANLATGEVLFFINPDTELIRANFPSLLAAFRFRPKAVYGMALMQASGVRESWSSGPFPSLTTVILAHLVPSVLPKPWQTDVVQQTDWVSGAACAVRREFFRSLGGFDEDFFLYFEDVDIARRASVFSAWVGVYPFVVLRHVGGQSHQGKRAKKEAYYAGQRRYFKKWRPFPEPALLALGHQLRLFFSRFSV